MVINKREASRSHIGLACQLLLVIGCCSVCSTAMGQRIVDEQGNRIQPGAKLERDKFNNSIPVWIAYDGYSALTAPSGQNEVTDYKFKFMEAALLIRKFTNTKDGLTYALVGASSNDQTASVYRGWVDTRYLLEKTSGERRPTGVLRKCMLVNRLSVIENAAKSEETRPDLVPVTLKPEPGAPVAETFRLNNVFIVYRALDTHVLIGTAEIFNAGLETQVIKGWVPLSRVSSWDTALALEWDHETAPIRDMPGLIVNEPKIARHLILPDGRRPEGEDKCLLFTEELQDGKTNRFEKDSKRYPILDEREAARVLKETPGQSEEAKMLNVGVFGGYTGDIDTKALKEKLNRVVLNAAHVDVLFVVDDSKGMETAFPKVADAIEKISELYRRASESTGDNRREVRVAVSYYADKEWSKEPFKAGKWVAIRSADEVKKLRTEVANHRQDAGGENAEDVLDGISHALEAAQLSRFGRRIVFVIGDMGDKSYLPDVKGASQRDIFDKKVEYLANRLVPKVGEPVELYALQVGSPLAKAQEYQWYEEQMKLLVSRVNTQWLQRTEEEDAIAEFARAEQLDELLTMITVRAQKAKQKIDDLMRVSRGALTGSWTASVSPATRARLRSYEIAWKDLLKDQGFEVYEEGLLWTHSPQSNKKLVKQTRGTVLVDEQAVRDLHFACQMFVKHIGVKAGPRRLSKEEFKKLIDRIRSVLIRESGTEEDLSKYFIDRALPVRSRLFQTQDAAGTDDKALTQDEVIDIMLKTLRLDDIIKGKDQRWKIEVIQQSTGGDILVPTAQLKDGREVMNNRWFSMDGDPNRLRYVYLDLEREIP